MRSASYAIVTYGAVAGSLLGSPSGRAVTEGDLEGLAGAFEW